MNPTQTDSHLTTDRPTLTAKGDPLAASIATPMASAAVFPARNHSLVFVLTISV